MPHAWERLVAAIPAPIAAKGRSRGNEASNLPQTSYPDRSTRTKPFNIIGHRAPLGWESFTCRCCSPPDPGVDGLDMFDDNEGVEVFLALQFFQLYQMVSNLLDDSREGLSRIERDRNFLAGE